MFPVISVPILSANGLPLPVKKIEMLRLGVRWVQNKATIGYVKRNDPEKLKVKRWKTVLNMS